MRADADLDEFGVEFLKEYLLVASCSCSLLTNFDQTN